MSQNVNALIAEIAHKYNLDPAAWRAIIQNESGGNPNNIGDGGTSFGLTQLHVGGALGRMSLSQARQYLDPRKNLEFAGRQMAGMGLGGLRGRAAIDAYARRFERPANPGAEINVAFNYYKAHAGDFKNLGAGAGASNFTSPAAATPASQGMDQQRQGLMQMLMQGSQPGSPAAVNQQTQDIMGLMQQGSALKDGAPIAQSIGKGVQSDVTGQPLSPNAASVIGMAKKYLGTKYVWGGTTPNGFDCSGFVQYLYGKKGIKLPRTTYEQIKVGQHINSQKDLQPGDIVFFSNHGDVHHEGLYIGNGQFIHAPHTGDVVKISSLSDPYYTQQFAGGRRV